MQVYSYDVYTESCDNLQNQIEQENPLTQTLKGNEKLFELTRVVLNFVYWINVLI